MNYFLKNLNYLVKVFDTTQSELALQVDKKHNTIGNWLEGRSEPRIQELIAICNFFDVSADQLISEDLEAGNLITKEQIRKFRAKGNLKGNPIGNLNSRKEVNVINGHQQKTTLNEQEEITLWVVLKELRQLSQKVDKMGISIELIVNNTAPKKE